jgi:hypothetical protein
MLEKECKYREGVYKVQTFRTTQARDNVHILYHQSVLLIVLL